MLHDQVMKQCKAHVEVAPFHDFNSEYVNAHQSIFEAVILSGTEALFSKRSDRARFSGVIEAIRDLQLPLLGICGGEQLMGIAFGEPVVPVGRFIRGYRNIEPLGDDPLFEGVQEPISVMQSHYEAVKSVPDSFKLLARSKATSVEAFRSSDGLMYGVQFHPECNDKAHAAGARILNNFGRLLTQ